MDLGRDKISTLLLRLSTPAVLSMFVAAIYNIVDRIFVGRIDSVGLSAIGVTMPFQIIQMAVVLLIGIGASTLISINYGKGDIQTAEKLLFSSFKYFIIVQLVMTALSFVFMEPLFKLLGIGGDLQKQSYDYISIILLGGVPGLLGYCMNNTVRSLGFSKMAMRVVIESSLMNIVLDAIMILGLGMGIKGAALATVLAQTYVTFRVLQFFLKNKDTPVRLRFDHAITRAAGKQFKDIFHNGLPSFYQQIFGTVVNIILNRTIIQYGGSNNLASVTIITSIAMIFTMLIYGITQGSQAIIGYNFGAQQLERSVEAIRMVLKVILVIAVSGLLIIQLFPAILVRPFSTDSELIRLTEHNIRIYMLGLPFIGIHSLTTTVMQSIRRPKISSILYILRFGAILIPALYIIPPMIGIDGVYVANALSDVGSGAVAFYFLLREMRKLLHRADELSADRLV